ESTISENSSVQLLLVTNFNKLLTTPEGPKVTADIIRLATLKLRSSLHIDKSTTIITTADHQRQYWSPVPTLYSCKQLSTSLLYLPRCYCSFHLCIRDMPPDFLFLGEQQIAIISYLRKYQVLETTEAKA
ncbi:hypothetical protein IFM46972_00828, partial [Aspergillus udagawae]